MILSSVGLNWTSFISLEQTDECEELNIIDREILCRLVPALVVGEIARTADHEAAHGGTLIALGDDGNGPERLGLEAGSVHGGCCRGRGTDTLRS